MAGRFTQRAAVVYNEFTPNILIIPVGGLLMRTLRDDANTIIRQIIKENLPQPAVESALKGHTFQGGITLLAIGKAAWTMADAAYGFLGKRIKKGLVITKHHHAKGPIADFEIIEAGHPIPDSNTILGAQKAIDIARALDNHDELLFLVSGGGSSLFEKPLDGISLDDLADVNQQLLSRGANIIEMNSIRKRFSSIKGGRFALLCEPAKIYAVILSDVVGDRLDSIASGPAAPDLNTVEAVLAIAEKYHLTLTETMRECLHIETPKQITNVKTVITGSVRTLCESAARASYQLGYKPVLLTTALDCEAKEAGRFLGAMAAEIGRGNYVLPRPCAIIAGGETVVHIQGGGLGGRNQELALSAALPMSGLKDVLIFSLGSDGTDGPTDAAGGIADGDTVACLKAMGISAEAFLLDNNSYHALKAVNGLIVTGPTGTNVNDITMLLCR